MTKSDTPKTGKIIMFDGPDGAGKTVQLTMAADALRKQGYDVYCTRIHGGTPLGELLREVSLSDTPRTPLADLLLSQVIQVELAHDLGKRLRHGHICLIDRSPLSMWAYQVRGSGLDEDIARPVIASSLSLLHPDDMLIYNTTLEILRQRLAGRGAAKSDYFESKPDAFHERVIAGYNEAAAEFDATVIDAGRSIDAVHIETMKHISRLLTDK